MFGCSDNGGNVIERRMEAIKGIGENTRGE
jgi:hypothetical protein